MNDPNYVAPNASPDVQKFILTARTMLYKMGDDLKAAMTGTHNLADGVASLLVQLITTLETKLGELSPEAAEQVLVHLAGPVVDMAKAQGDPDAQDTKRAVVEIVGKAMEMMMQEEGQESPQEQAQEQQPQGLMAYGR